jgi:hypothetical protein
MVDGEESLFKDASKSEVQRFKEKTNTNENDPNSIS